ncbi:hypothetical protein ACVWZ6_002558 [Bradyrhizobium sp. GM6.1]
MVGSGTVAARAVAVIGPTPGIEDSNFAIGGLLSVPSVGSQEQPAPYGQWQVIQQIHKTIYGFAGPVRQ